MDIFLVSGSNILSGYTFQLKVGRPFNGGIVANKSPYSVEILTGSLIGSKLPDGLKLTDNFGSISGVPAAAGIFSSRIKVTSNGVSDYFSVQFEIEYGEPIFTDRFVTTNAGEFFNKKLVLENEGARPLTSCSATGLPTGATLNPSTLEISGTVLEAGSYRYQITATGPGGTSESEGVIEVRGPITLYSWPVIGTNENWSIAPTLPEPITGNTFNLKVGKPFKALIKSNFVNYSVQLGDSGALPNGLTLKQDGTISGTPINAGNISAQIKIVSGQIVENWPIIFSVEYGSPIFSRAELFFRTQAGAQFSKKLVLQNESARPLTSCSATGLPTGATLNPSTGEISGTVIDAGSYNFSIVATGPGGTSPGLPGRIDVQGESGLVPSIVSGQTFQGKVGNFFVANIAIANGPASFSATDLPVGLAINSSTGLIIGTPSVIANATAFITTENEFGSITGSLAINIAAGAPKIIPGQSFFATIGQPLNKTFLVDNLANRPVSSWSATGLPAGLSINASTGEVTGMPQAVGTSSITLTATGEGGTGTQSATIVVQQELPAFDAQSLTIKVGEPFEAMPQTSKPSVPVDSFTAIGVLPAGLTLNPATGKVSGTPTEYKSTPTVTQIRAINSTGSTTYSITFAYSYGTPRPKNRTFALAVNQPVSFSLDLANANFPVTNWSLSDLPAGLELNLQTGQVSGTPQVILFQNVTATATGPGGIGTSEIVFDIGNPVAEILPFEISVDLESPVSLPVTFAEGVYSAPTQTIVEGLPQGLSLGNNVISGSALESGEFLVQITTSNKYGQATETVKITVPKGAPRISPGQSFQLKTDRKFSQKIETDNPVSRPVAQWTANLPSGLRISSDGVVSGFAQSPGTFNVTFTATSGFGTDSKTIQFVISGNRFYGVKSPVLQPGRTVRAFSSGLVAVTEPYKMRPAFESTARAIFSEGSRLDAESTSKSPLIIYPAPDFRSGDAGFVECTVTAYGITNSPPVTTTSRRLQSVRIFDKQNLPGGAVTYTERTEQLLVNYHVLKSAVVKGGSVDMPTGTHGIAPKIGYTLNANLILERYDVTNYGGYDEIVAASGYTVHFTQI